MDDFADNYIKGWTPNPCVRCNGVLKFQVLLQRAKALGASHLATGHYAKVDETGSLFRAVDPIKDQTYFLFPATRAAFKQTLFPLGGMSKAEVRAHAERLGLVTSSKPESQEVCFIPDADHTRFILDYRDNPDLGGDIVDEEGTVLGQHDGYFRYTVGQRRGLGVAVGYPLYVLRIEANTRRVVVGPADRLLKQGLLAKGMNWFRYPEPGEEVHARIRHNGGLIPAKIDGRDEVTVHFEAPARAVAPGQAVVLYHGDEVLGGGWIRKSL